MLIPDSLKKSLRENISLKEYSAFKTGGQASFLFEPDSIILLQKGLKFFSEQDIPTFMLAGGTNILIHDQGFNGAVISLKGEFFSRCEITDNKILCGSNLSNHVLSNKAQKAGISGFEFLGSIPGKLGGAIKGNAGAYGKDICSSIEELYVFDLLNGECLLKKDELVYSYRKLELSENVIITGVLISGEYADFSSIEESMRSLRDKRVDSQPQGFSCGSIFKNPQGLKAWEIIDRLELRGVLIGGARISEKHSNWIINEGNATSSDIWECISLVKRMADEKLDLKLDLEINLLGQFDLSSN